ncbi:MAG: hypothetical protein GTO14_06065 [Anaerolineales bacterium]|nr:hypothetical protein [Anaerolineales bacterium]
MKKKDETSSPTGWSRCRSSITGRIVGVSLLVLILAGLACSLPSERASDALDATKLALEVEATTLALEKLRLTMEAESQEEPTTQPPPPPTTEAPPPPPEVPTDTPETEEPPSPEDEAVEGSLVRASYDPAYGWGAGHDSESFDGTKGKFPASTAGAATAWYGDGRYNISFTSRNRWTWYWSFIDTYDFYADVVVFNGDKCVPGDTAGIVFRGHSTFDYGLMFGISCGGEYFIGFTAVPGVDGVICAFKDTGFIDCNTKAMKVSELIQTGPGAINRIGVRAKGQDVDYYINGKWVATRSLAVYWPSFDHGFFALYLGSAQKPDARVSFDDFSIWYLD